MGLSGLALCSMPPCFPHRPAYSSRTTARGTSGGHSPVSLGLHCLSGGGPSVGRGALLSVHGACTSLLQVLHGADHVLERLVATLAQCVGLAAQARLPAFHLALQRDVGAQGVGELVDAALDRWGLACALLGHACLW
eukprot:2189838-Alexandrium_andersonii.AAC.1